jgi:hypothetical protein
MYGNRNTLLTIGNLVCLLILCAVYIHINYGQPPLAIAPHLHSSSDTSNSTAKHIATFSLSLNEQYMFIAPLTAHIWIHHGFGLRIGLIGDSKRWEKGLPGLVRTTLFAAGAELIHISTPGPGKSTPWALNDTGWYEASIAQVSRLYMWAYPGLSQEQWLVTTDSDIWPLEPWIGPLVQESQDKGYFAMTTNTKWASNPMESGYIGEGNKRRRLGVWQYPMSHIAMSVGNWSHVISEWTSRRTGKQVSMPSPVKCTLAQCTTQLGTLIAQQIPLLVARKRLNSKGKPSPLWSVDQDLISQALSVAPIDGIHHVRGPRRLNRPATHRRCNPTGKQDAHWFSSGGDSVKYTGQCAIEIARMMGIEDHQLSAMTTYINQWGKTAIFAPTSV